MFKGLTAGSVAALMAASAIMSTSTPAAAAETRAPTANYRLEIQLVDARDIGEGWLDDLEVYAKWSSITWDDGSNYPAHRRDVWSGSRYTTDTSVNRQRFQAPKQSSMRLQIEVWEGDFANGDDYLGRVTDYIPVDGKWKRVRTVGGEHGKDDFGRPVQSYADFNVRLAEDPASVERTGSVIRVEVSKVRVDGWERIVVKRNGKYLGEIYHGTVYYGYAAGEAPNSRLFNFGGVAPGDRITVATYGGTPGEAIGAPWRMLVDTQV